MIRSQHLTSLFFINALTLATSWAQAPQLSNKGALISIKQNATISVHGSVHNANNGTFHNTNELFVRGDWTNNANNEAFTSLATGMVHLLGDTQRINGSHSTRFYDLSLENTGVKWGFIDVFINGTLQLHDREFNLDTNTVHVFNTDINAVTTGLNNNFGFVSASRDGGILRHTDQTQAYLFPVGSALSPARFRPVFATPSQPVATAYKVRFSNTDATNEGFDRQAHALQICDLQPAYYHRLSHSGSIPATFQFLYKAASDGIYTHLAQWSGAQWDEATALAASTNSTYNLDVLTTNATISSFAPNPFAFARVAPPIDLQLSANPICSNDTLTLTASGNFSEFDFYIDRFLVQTSTQPTFTTTRPAGTSQIWVVGTNGSCGRHSDTTALLVNPAVQAIVSPDTIIVAGTAATLHATGGAFYDWSPIDYLACPTCATTQANPPQTMDYIVRIENIEGCSALDTVRVTVKENVENVLFIPNVLTPNNDGKNDTWFIRNVELFPRNRVRILNRWGDVVYQSEYYMNTWDGSFGGGKLPAGTYYYILDLGDNWGVFKGDVTIIR